MCYLLNPSVISPRSPAAGGLAGPVRGRRRSGGGRESRPGLPGPVRGDLGDCSLSWWPLPLWTAINTIPAPVSMLDFTP